MQFVSTELLNHIICPLDKISHLTRFYVVIGPSGSALPVSPRYTDNRLGPPGSGSVLEINCNSEPVSGSGATGPSIMQHHDSPGATGQHTDPCNCF